MRVNARRGPPVISGILPRATTRQWRAWRTPEGRVPRGLWRRCAPWQWNHHSRRGRALPQTPWDTLKYQKLAGHDTRRPNQGKASPLGVPAARTARPLGGWSPQGKPDLIHGGQIFPWFLDLVGKPAPPAPSLTIQPGNFRPNRPARNEKLGGKLRRCPNWVGPIRRADGRCPELKPMANHAS